MVTFNGTYIGYFHRANMDTSQVSIRFIANAFDGQASKLNYPAIGKGSFEQKENTIRFNDTTLKYSNLDSTLILNGIYRYDFNEDGTIRIWKKIGSKTNEFILKRPVR